MAMSIRGLPDDVKDTLKKKAQNRGVSLNAFVVEVLTQQAEDADPVMKAVESYAGKFTREDMLEARRLERESALDWSMSHDDPSGRQRDRSDGGGRVEAAG